MGRSGGGSSNISDPRRAARPCRRAPPWRVGISATPEQPYTEADSPSRAQNTARLPGSQTRSRMKKRISQTRARRIPCASAQSGPEDSPYPSMRRNRSATTTGSQPAAAASAAMVGNAVTAARRHCKRASPRDGAAAPLRATPASAMNVLSCDRVAIAG